MECVVERWVAKEAVGEAEEAEVKPSRRLAPLDARFSAMAAPMPEGLLAWYIAGRD